MWRTLVLHHDVDVVVGDGVVADDNNDTLKF
jgi:hypothetical protein